MNILGASPSPNRHCSHNNRTTTLCAVLTLLENSDGTLTPDSKVNSVGTEGHWVREQKGSPGAQSKHGCPVWENSQPPDPIHKPVSVCDPAHQRELAKEPVVAGRRMESERSSLPLGQSVGVLFSALSPQETHELQSARHFRRVNSGGELLSLFFSPYKVIVILNCKNELGKHYLEGQRQP